MSPTFRVLASVMCDEVRRDMDGSGIILGATNRGPALANCETVLQRLGFYVEGVAVDVEEVVFRLRNVDEDTIVFSDTMTFPYKDDTLTVRPDFDFSKMEVNVQLMLNLQNLKFEKPGVYQLEYQILDQPWVEVRTYLFPPQDELEA
ncbi:DUF6941 family protein [Pseudorhodobacter wandonensis]|uniref:DUF6941 family protein n=1 Tax=Pseudorhodobacter wandonensis TaxID=1120568 RepID=UPI00067D4CF3|nr:hypothetical protein [Pseudorhodobacter wandonensis]